GLVGRRTPDPAGRPADRRPATAWQLAWDLDTFQELLREVGDKKNEALALDWTARSHMALGKRKQARQAWQEAQPMYQDPSRDTDVNRVRQQLAALDEAKE